MKFGGQFHDNADQDSYFQCKYENAARVALLSGVAAAAPLLAAGSTDGYDFEQGHAGHDHDSPAKLVEIVREATRRFRDFHVAKYTVTCVPRLRERP